MYTKSLINDALVQFSKKDPTFDGIKYQEYQRDEVEKRYMRGVYCSKTNKQWLERRCSIVCPAL